MWNNLIDPRSSRKTARARQEDIASEDTGDAMRVVAKRKGVGEHAADFVGLICFTERLLDLFSLHSQPNNEIENAFELSA